MNGIPFEDMSPYYRNFDGTIENLPNGNCAVKGLIELNPDTDVVTIKELPIKKWTKNYKDWLDKEM